MTFIVSDLLDLSKLAAGKLAFECLPFELPDSVASLVRVYQPLAAQKGLDLRLTVAPDVPRFVLGDWFRLRQCIINLVSANERRTLPPAVSLKFVRRAHALCGLRFRT